MVDIAQKKHLLEELIGSLSLLIDMPKMEPDLQNQYAPFFEPLLEKAQLLSADGFTFEDLKDLSYSLEGLMNRSFLDYSPSIFNKDTGRFSAINGTENYQEVLSEVSKLILELRVISTSR